MRLLSLLLLGCGGKSTSCLEGSCLDTGSAPAASSSSPPGSATTGTSPQTTTPPPTGLRVTGGGFGWDPVSGQAVEVTLSDGTVRPPWITISAIDGTELKCSVTLTAAGPLTPRLDGWVSDKGLLIGVEIPPDSVESDCALSDPSWSERMALVPSQSWGLGVQRLNPTTQSYAMAALGEDWFPLQFEALSIGWYWSELEGAFDGTGYREDGLGFATDVREDMTVYEGLEGPVRLTADEALPDDVPNRAWFTLDQTYVNIELR